MDIKVILKTLLAVIGIMIMASACTQNTKKDILIEMGKNPEKVKIYRENMKQLVKDIDKNQPDYKHLPLKVKDDFDWFYIQTYAVWEKSIDKNQFMKNGIKRYPEYRESLEYLADKLTE